MMEKDGEIYIRHTEKRYSIDGEDHYRVVKNHNFKTKKYGLISSEEINLSESFLTKGEAEEFMTKYKKNHRR